MTSHVVVAGCVSIDFVVFFVVVCAREICLNVTCPGLSLALVMAAVEFLYNSKVEARRRKVSGGGGG